MDLDPARVAYVVARAADYFGMALFLGGLIFLAVLWPRGGDHRGARGVVLTGWLLGSLGTLAAIGFEGAWVADRPVGDFLDTDLLGTVLDVHFGQVWFARALIWLLAGVVLAQLLQRGSRAAGSLAWRAGLVAVGAGLARTVGMIGHTVESRYPLLSQLADFVHVLGVCAWIGGLAVLLFGVLARRRPDELAVVVPRYSKLAMLSVTAVVLTGAVLGWQTVGTIGKLFTTEHGQVLLVKLAVLALVLLIAQASRGWVARRLDFAVVLRGDAATVRPFVYSVAAETTLVIVVVFAASLLVTTSPGR